MASDLRHTAVLVLAIAGLSALLLALRYLLNTYEHFFPDIDAAKALVSATSSLYGVLTAFTIYAVWNSYNDTTNAIDQEAHTLINLFRAATYLDDVVALASFDAAIRDYITAVVQDEWIAMERGLASQVASAAFERIFAAVQGVRFDDERDEVAWGMILRKFDELANVRVRRVELATRRRPRRLRILLYLTSFGLLAGFFMLGIHNDVLRVCITVMPVIIVVLVDDIISDLDNPFTGHWAIEATAFGEIPAQLDRLARPEGKPSPRMN